MSGPSEVVLDQVLMEVKVRHPRLEQDIGFLRISFQHSIHISGHVDIKTAGHSRGSATIADISTLGERPDGDLKFIGQFYFFWSSVTFSGATTAEGINTSCRGCGTCHGLYSS